MAHEIKAPLSGKIMPIDIKVGEEIEEDDEVIIIEAMKMETPVYAPADGVVKEILVKEGQSVEEDDTLVIIE